ncbi:MAG: hypothetical protein EOO20_12935 [Chryseobacterium sp.]|nr:MAG: hypothetical protein EOO20_12935 [Chryseobacterium sp.]
MPINNQKLEKIKETKNFIQKLWGDPVWSKVISAAFLSIFTFLYALSKSFFDTINVSKIGFIDLIRNAVNFKISVFWILISTLIITASVMLLTLYRRWKHKQSIVQNYFDVDHKIGNFTFKELYNSLLNNFIQTPAYLVAAGYPERDNLLVLWRVHLNYFNMGITIDDMGEQAKFLYFQLCPLLISYGLIKQTTIRSFDNTHDMISLISTEANDLFFASMEKWIIYKNINGATDPLIYSPK